MSLLADVIGYGTHAARPTAGSAGRLYYETDTTTLFRDSGTVWTALTLGGGGSAGDFTKIAEVVVPSGGSPNILFTGIAGSDSGLEVWLRARGDTAAGQTALHVQLNGDTAANYNYVATTDYFGASGASDISAAAAYIEGGYISAATAPAGCIGTARLTLPGYAGTTWRKALLSDYGWNTTDGSTGLISGNGWGEWKNTAPITSILLFPASGNFVEGSVASLYGIR